jgi:hypothetical protein
MLTDRRALVLYLSRTGTGARVARDAARALGKMGYRADLRPLEPRFDLPYLLWLLLSFIPALATPINKLDVDPGDYDRCVLVMPKWTFNCPPVESFLGQYASKLPPTFLLVICGGWDEDRYMESYRGKLVSAGAEVSGEATVRGDQVSKPHFPRLLEIELSTKV